MMSTGHTKLSIVLWKVPENKIRTNEIQLVTDKSNLQVIFYISYLFPISDLKSSNRVQRIHSKRLWIDVYRVKDNKTFAEFHYIMKYWFNYNISYRIKCIYWVHSLDFNIQKNKKSWYSSYLDLSYS